MTIHRSESTVGSLTSLAKEIVPEIEESILQLVVDGYQRWRDRGFNRYGDREDDYTVRLVRCMNEIRRERNHALVPRYQHIEASDEMFNGQEDPAHAPRIDMIVSWDFLADEAYFSIECKRLALDDLARRYVVEGINRFVTGYYGAKARVGAMIGYVVKGSPEGVLEKVNRHVEQSAQLGLEHVLTPTTSIGWLETVFLSNHHRPMPFAPIRLTHLFFDMTELPSTSDMVTARTSEIGR